MNGVFILKCIITFFSVISKFKISYFREFENNHVPENSKLPNFTIPTSSFKFCNQNFTIWLKIDFFYFIETGKGAFFNCKCIWIELDLFCIWIINGIILPVKNLLICMLLKHFQFQFSQFNSNQNLLHFKFFWITKLFFSVYKQIKLYLLLVNFENIFQLFNVKEGEETVFLFIEHNDNYKSHLGP